VAVVRQSSGGGKGCVWLGGGWVSSCLCRCMRLSAAVNSGDGCTALLCVAAAVLLITGQVSEGRQVAALLRLTAGGRISTAHLMEHSPSVGHGRCDATGPDSRCYFVASTASLLSIVCTFSTVPCSASIHLPFHWREHLVEGLFVCSGLVVRVRACAPQAGGKRVRAPSCVWQHWQHQRH
jgi:hypothetical protein